MPSELIKQLLEAGVHFGHKTSRWNPKMQCFIFGERSGIYIIDLEKTEECLSRARDFLLEIAAKGEAVLFVGTKKQAQEVVRQEAIRCGMYYVTERWPGGLLTNLETIKKRLARLKEIETMKEDGTYAKLTKKEVAHLEKERVKLHKNFSGIINMEQMPKAVFIVDTKKEETALAEAKKLSIPIIGLIDTNSDPEQISFPIPGNDDATKSIALICQLLADSIISGRQRFLSYLSQEGVALKEVVREEIPPIPAQEEAEIKEISEVVDSVLPPEEGDKPARKAPPHQKQETRTRPKKSK